MPSEEQCPCGRDKVYAECCGRYHSQAMRPLTAEQLMRSRYSAFTLGLMGYLDQTLLPVKRQAEPDSKPPQDIRWTSLEIVEKEAGGPKDMSGTVTFKAHYLHDGLAHWHEEKSQFRKRDGQWYYVKPLRLK